jgi:hypothetical protein
MKPCLTVLTVIIIALSACTTQPDESRLRWINESLVNSNKIIEEATISIYHDMEFKQRDLLFRAKTGLWLPRVAAIRSMSANMNAYINELKQALRQHAPNDLFGKSHKAQALFRRLTLYKDSLTAALDPHYFVKHSWYSNRLQQDFPWLRDSLSIHPEDSIRKIMHLTDATPLDALIVLNKIQNDVLASENTMANYCKDMTSPGCILEYETFTGIIASRMEPPPRSVKHYATPSPHNFPPISPVFSISCRPVQSAASSLWPLNSTD